MEIFHDPQPPDNKNTIEKAIQKIRFEKVEHLYIFKNGKQKRHFIGTENEIVVESKYLIDLKDATIVHNHPQCTSFSFEDFLAIVKNDAKELILVTTTSIYTVTRGENWKIKFDSEFGKIFNSSTILAENLFNKEIAKMNFQVMIMKLIKCIIFDC